MKISSHTVFNIDLYACLSFPQVSIFSLLEEGKFEHFKPVMDTYIKGHFAAALVYK